MNDMYDAVAKLKHTIPCCTFSSVWWGKDVSLWVCVVDEVVRS